MRCCRWRTRRAACRLAADCAVAGVVDDRTASMFPAVAYARTLALRFRHSADVPPGICRISPERLGLLRAESAGSTQAGSI